MATANLLTGYPNNQIPKSQLNPYTQSLLNLLYPLPNYGPAGAIANNYLGRIPDLPSTAPRATSAWIKASAPST